MVTFRQRCGLNYPRRRMGPKKKAGGGKKKKKDAPGKDIGILSALSTQEMTKEQLEQQVLQLREELKKEQEERNYFQLERDKIHTFWEITRKQLEEKRAEMRNKDKEMEDAEERHQVEIKVYKQKVKHLLFEQQNSLAEVQIDATVKMKVAEEKYRENEVQLRKHLNRRKLQMKEQEMASSDVVKNVKMKHTETMSHLRDDFNRQVSEIETKYKEKMHQLQEELKLQRKTDLHELEENKNGQINSLVKCHEKSFSDMKNYYNDITLNNLSVINTLKEQLQKSKKHEERMEREMLDLNVQKRQVVDRLEKAQGELVELRKDLENYTKDKRLLANNKVRIKVLEAEKKELKWEMEVLEQRFDKVEEERDELRGHFVTTLNEVQQCSNLQSIVLERKLAALETTLEKKDAQLDKVLSTCNLAPEDVTVVTQKVEDVLDYKNGAIKQLQFELARACKAHNDLLRAYKEKLAAQGLPQVCRRLGIIEVDYFGLHTVRNRSRIPSCWINLRNRLLPQLGSGWSGGVFRLHFKVKFFVEPHFLLQESTRHLFYLHIREELESGRLACNPDIATRICGLIAQAEFGDHWPSVLANPSYPRLPNTIPQRVSEEHLAQRSTTRSTCEYHILQLALRLEGLSTEWHKTRGVQGDVLHVSVGTDAIVVQREDGTEVQRILFLTIQQASVSRRLLNLEVTAPCGDVWKTELQLCSSQAASNLYRSIIEHHTFYSCDTVTIAVKDQCSCTLKDHLASLLFSESTATRKTYDFDVQRTAREAYEHFRRVLYHAAHALEIVGDLAGTETSQAQFSVDMKSGTPGDQIEGNELGGEILTEHQQQRDGTQWNDKTVVACATCQDKAEAWQRQQEAFLCVMCCQQEVGAAFCPCGHVICCEPCASHLQVCPVCRHDVERIQQIYLPVGPFLHEA